LGHRLLLFGDLHRLDREVRLLGAVEADHHRASNFELLHAERDALLLDIDVEHLRLDGLALVVKRQRFLARHAPGDVRHVDHAVDVVVEADEQAELGLVLDLALDHEPTGCFSAKASHGLLCACLRPSEMRRFSSSTSSTLDLDLLEVETILPGWTFFLVQLISETWTRPSMPGSSSTNAPYSVMLVTRPLNTPPDRVRAARPPTDRLSSCFMPRRCAASRG
jgi:hypothetical protein